MVRLQLQMELRVEQIIMSATLGHQHSLPQKLSIQSINVGQSSSKLLLGQGERCFAYNSATLFAEYASKWWSLSKLSGIYVTPDSLLTCHCAITFLLLHSVSICLPCLPFCQHRLGYLLPLDRIYYSDVYLSVSIQN